MIEILFQAHIKRKYPRQNILSAHQNILKYKIVHFLKKFLYKGAVIKYGRGLGLLGEGTKKFLVSKAGGAMKKILVPKA